MANRIEGFFSFVLTAAALVVAIVIVRREFVSKPTQTRATPTALTLEYDADWETMLQHGIAVGPASASLQLMEFVDFECPVCRRFHQTTFKELLQRYSNQLAIIYLHSPISSHRFARISAQASECAASSGRFAQLVDLLFEKQDSLGLKSWASFGREAGLSDTAGFQGCVLGPTSFARIDSGLVLVDRKEIRGTPTFFLNGWRFSTTPTQQQLFRVADSLLTGRKPAL